MKKRFLFGALMFSAIAMAQPAYQNSWLLVSSANADNKVQQDFSDIQFNNQGEAYIYGHFGTAKNSQPGTTTFMGQTFNGASYGTTGTSYNKNMFLVKLDADNQVLWSVYSNEGEEATSNTGNAMLLTSDGGVVLALKTRYTEGNKAGGENTPSLAIVDALGTKTTFTYDATKRVYQPILVKLDANGRLVGSKQLDCASEKGTENFAIYDITADEAGNIYLAGVTAETITIDGHAISTPKTTSYTGSSYSTKGDGFILKLDADLNYVSHLMMAGTPSLQPKGLQWANGALFMYGFATGAAEQEITIGAQSFNMTTAKEVVTAKLNADLAVENVNHYASSATMMDYQLTVAEDEQSFYYTGALVGAITIDETTKIESANTQNGRYNGVIIQFDTQTGAYMNSWVKYESMTATTNASFCGWKVMEVGNALYVPVFSQGSGYLYLYEFDGDLNYRAEHLISKMGGGSFVFNTYAANNFGNKVLIGDRPRNNQNYLIGDQTYKDANTSWYGVLSAWELPEPTYTSSAAQAEDAPGYYSTFYHSGSNYEVPAGVRIFTATQEDAALTFHAYDGKVIPAGEAVVLRSETPSFDLTLTGAAADGTIVQNDLLGTDEEVATPANTYVLSNTGEDAGGNTVNELAFYLYTGSTLAAHKAYAVYSAAGEAPRRMTIQMPQMPTDVANEQADEQPMKSQKVMMNGQMFIIRNGERYTIQGTKMN